jgi:hypothetical protein
MHIGFIRSVLTGHFDLLVVSLLVVFAMMNSPRHLLGRKRHASRDRVSSGPVVDL